MNLKFAMSLFFSIFAANSIAQASCFRTETIKDLMKYNAKNPIPSFAIFTGKIKDAIPSGNALFVKTSVEISRVYYGNHQAGQVIDVFVLAVDRFSFSSETENLFNIYDFSNIKNAVMECTNTGSVQRPNIQKELQWLEEQQK